MSSTEDLELNDPNTSDLVLLVHGTRIYAHREYLSRKSERFAALLSDRWANQKEVEITEYDYETIISYLQFLYTEEIEFTWENIESLYDLSVGYCENSLKIQCQKYLEEQGILDPEQYYEFSDRIRLLFSSSVAITVANVTQLYSHPETGFREQCDEFLKNQIGTENMLRCCEIVNQLERSHLVDYYREWTQKQELTLDNCFALFDFTVELKMLDLRDRVLEKLTEVSYTIALDLDLFTVNNLEARRSTWPTIFDFFKWITTSKNFRQILNSGTRYDEKNESDYSKLCKKIYDLYYYLNVILRIRSGLRERSVVDSLQRCRISENVRLGLNKELYPEMLNEWHQVAILYGKKVYEWTGYRRPKRFNRKSYRSYSRSWFEIYQALRNQREDTSEWVALTREFWPLTEELTSLSYDLFGSRWNSRAALEIVQHGHPLLVQYCVLDHMPQKMSVDSDEFRILAKHLEYGANSCQDRVVCQLAKAVRLEIHTVEEFARDYGHVSPMNERLRQFVMRQLNSANARQSAKPLIEMAKRDPRSRIWQLIQTWVNIPPKRAKGQPNVRIRRKFKTQVALELNMDPPEFSRTKPVTKTQNVEEDSFVIKIELSRLRQMIYER